MKTKCLIIIPGIPYPPVDGHKLKIFNLIKILHQVYDLHIVTISRAIPSKDELGFIESHSYKNAHFKITLASAFLRLICNVFLKRPFQVAFFTLKKVKKYLKTHSKNDEIVFANLIRTASYLEALIGHKKIFDMVDLLSQSYYKSYTTTNSFIYKTIYKIESKRLAYYEKQIVNQSNLTLCVNYEESLTMKQYGNVLWLPNGIKEELFSYSNYQAEYKNSIAFFGTMFYQPNIDAVIWFEKNVIPYLNKDIIFYVIGARPHNSILQLAKKNKKIVVTGFLEDPYIILNSCFAVVAPMQNGGGIQNKILETMGMGKINVLSDYGGKPILGAKHNVHFYIADEGMEMADIINDIFLNPNKHNEVGINAKDLILKNYTWASYKQQLLNAMSKL